MKRLLQLALFAGLLACTPSVHATFPTFAGACTLSTRANNNTDDAVDLPASIASGDLILEFHFKDGAGTYTYPGSWQEIKDAQDGTGTISVGIAYLIASGGETSVTVTTTHAERFTAITCRIAAAAWHGTTPPEVSTGASGTGADGPDPDAVTASWGSADNLFIAVAAADINADVDAFPTNYADNQTLSDTTASSAHGGIATRELAASSDNPGAFSLDASEQWWAGTVVVRPAGGAPPAAPPQRTLLGVGQ